MYKKSWPPPPPLVNGQHGLGTARIFWACAAAVVKKCRLEDLDFFETPRMHQDFFSRRGHAVAAAAVPAWRVSKKSWVQAGTIRALNSTSAAAAAPHVFFTEI